MCFALSTLRDVWTKVSQSVFRVVFGVQQNGSRPVGMSVFAKDSILTTKTLNVFVHLFEKMANLNRTRKDCATSSGGRISRDAYHKPHQVVVDIPD
jgi:hypothetical protein